MVYAKSHPPAVRIILILLVTYHVTVVSGQNSLPDAGKFINNKPVGKGWVNLLTSLGDWKAEKEYWKLSNGIMHGEMDREKLHHYSYTNKVYTDFELNVMVKMIGGDDANSGVCIRIHPANFDDAPGYQVDMGKGYWGSLWEERKAGMVQKYPDSLAIKVAKLNDWNHYYIVADGHHIQAWLNGVKTIDVVHEAGFADGNIGLQLCHEKSHTILEVKSMYVREIK